MTEDVRQIIVLMFEGGTSQSQKQEAIDLIDGDVVGGIRSRDDIEGYYRRPDEHPRQSF